jgi:hypothetical protein
MRAVVALLVALVALGSVGCYHDKYDVNHGAPKREEYIFPPDQARFNEPETATYRATPPQKKQDTVLNRGGPVSPSGRLSP